MAIETIDLPMKNGDCPLFFFVCLPEGNVMFLSGFSSGEITDFKTGFLRKPWPICSG